jgi:hypothetical protein
LRLGCAAEMERGFFLQLTLRESRSFASSKTYVSFSRRLDVGPPFFPGMRSVSQHAFRQANMHIHGGGRPIWIKRFRCFLFFWEAVKKTNGLKACHLQAVCFDLSS